MALLSRNGNGEKLSDFLGLFMETKMDVPTQVKRVFIETFKVLETDYSEDLGPGDIQEWDSLGNVRLMQAIETHFGVSFDIMDLIDVETLSDVVLLVERYQR